jgi:hypothetical protein
VAKEIMGLSRQRHGKGHLAGWVWKEDIPEMDWQRIGSEISSVLTLVLLIKLYACGLTRRYCYFSFYLLFESICGPLLLLVKRGTTTYGAIWLVSKPVLWILCVLVLLEIYSLVMNRYPGIASLMRWAATAAAVSSAAISILSLTLDFRNPDEPFPLLRYAFAVQRTVDVTMAISVVVPLLFMLRFPVRLSRNAVSHCILFSSMACVEAGALFVRNWFGNGSAAIGNLGMDHSAEPEGRGGAAAGRSDVQSGDGAAVARSAASL